MRHAIAEERDPARWPDDSRRPLTPDGTARFRAGARGLERIGVRVDAVLSSGYTRAWETAVLLAEEIGWPAPEECPPLEAERPPVEALAALAVREEVSLALVGHEPHLSQLASLLLSAREDGLRLELKKGAAMCLACSGRPAAGEALLRWSVTPRTLRRLGR